MYEQCIIAQFDNTEKARLALEVLAKAGYGEQQVSFVSRSEDPQLGNVSEMERDAADEGGGSAGAGMGGLLGGALTAPIAASTLLGPFILAGPLVGVGVGAALGGMLGGAQQWGVTPEAGETYEQSVRDGAVLIIVTGDKAELREAEASLKTVGPESIRHFGTPE